MYGCLLSHLHGKGLLASLSGTTRATIRTLVEASTLLVIGALAKSLGFL
jgi:hypothetical protein